MASGAGAPRSLFWRIDVSGDLDVGAYDDEDACSAASAMSVVLRSVALTNLPLLAHVYDHKCTDPAYNDVDGVIRRWREPSHFDVHGLVRVQGDVAISEIALREKLMEAVDSMELLYLDDYLSWSLTDLSEVEFNTMSEEDMNRACHYDI